MYEATRKIRQVFSSDCQTARTGNEQEVLSLKEKWEHIYSRSHTKTQKNYCKMILKAINVSLVKHKYKRYKETGVLQG